MTEPGLDIQEEILVRLELNDLLRFKSVCKSWNTLISSRRFIKSHLNYTVKKKEENNETGDTRITALTTSSMCCDDCFYRRNRECQVIGSSNGLVCISRYDKDFLVVNPSTREVKELRNPRWSGVSGFGYDSSIDDYKFVIGYKNEHRKLVFEVLTLKSNVWRSVAVESGYYNLDGDGILCNGGIHWISTRKKKQVIVSFDLSKEVLKEIPKPKLGRREWQLGSMKGCLCILYDFENSIKIWVMRKYSVQESWERVLPPPGYDDQKAEMEYSPHDSFFDGHVHIWLLEEGAAAPVLVRSIERPVDEYNSDITAHYRLSTISDCNYNYDEHIFVKSLVSPHDMGNDDNGNCNERRVKRKRQKVISSDGDGTVKSRRESHLTLAMEEGNKKKKEKRK